jgi:hypothetical protein
MVATLAASSMLTSIPEAFDPSSVQSRSREGDGHPGREKPPRTGRYPDAGPRKGDLNMP